MIAYCNNDIVLLEKIFLNCAVTIRHTLICDRWCCLKVSALHASNVHSIQWLLESNQAHSEATISMWRLRCDDDDSYQVKN
jgi:hypothetical protein